MPSIRKNKEGMIIPGLPRSARNDEGVEGDPPVGKAGLSTSVEMTVESVRVTFDLEEMPDGFRVKPGMTKSELLDGSRLSI